MTFQLRLTVAFNNQSVPTMTSLEKKRLMEDVLNRMFGRMDILVSELLFLASTTVKDSFMFAVVLVNIVDKSEPLLLTIFNQTVYGTDIVGSYGNGSLSLHVSFSQEVDIVFTDFEYQFQSAMAIDHRHHRLLENDFLVNKSELQIGLTYPVISKLSFCVQVVLQRSEVYDYVDIIDIRRYNIRLYNGDFERTESNAIRMCQSDYLSAIASPSAGSSTPTPQAILSVVCNTMSIAGLTVTLITYFIFGTLRSIPGKNNLMLALHLLIAQSLYQFAMGESAYPRLCVGLGVLVHFFWLTAILWMNACTLHMYRTFVSGKSYRSTRTCDLQVCIYTGYCYVVATIIVCINIGVSLLRTDGNSLGYGGSICYISEPIMVGWLFALPVGLVIILNIAFFFAVVYRISASTMTRDGKSDRDNTVIYMKLSSLTGVTWIFGFLYIWTQFVAFEYIFIVLNAGQGVLIFVSFICTPRISKLYVELLRKYSSWLANHCPCGHPPHKTPETSLVELQSSQNRRVRKLPSQGGESRKDRYSEKRKAVHTFSVTDKQTNVETRAKDKSGISVAELDMHASVTNRTLGDQHASDGMRNLNTYPSKYVNARADIDDVSVPRTNGDVVGQHATTCKDTSDIHVDSLDYVNAGADIETHDMRESGINGTVVG